MGHFCFKPGFFPPRHDFLIRIRYCILISSITIEKPKNALHKIREKMKYLLYLLFFISIKISAQDISGIYSGTLTNDSLKMTQNYELALSEYRGKITGYSYITFVTNDTFYYGIKRIKASRKNGELVVEDVEMLANNYPKRPDKGVHVINRIPLPPGQDTILDMNGKWETTGTKKFYSIGGNMSLRKDDDSTHSPLIAHLKELKVINYQEEKKDNRSIAKTEIKQKPKETKPVVKEAAYADKPKEITTQKPPVKEVAAVSTNDNPIAVKKEDPPIQKVTKAAETTPNPIASNEKKMVENKPVAVQPKPIEVKTTTPSIEQEKNSVVSAPKEKVSVKETAPKEIKPTTTTSIQPKEIKPTATANTQPKETNTVSPQVAVNKEPIKVVPREEPKITVTPSVIEKRVTNTIQTVTVSADSLILSFYDNGVVDGDSISVYLNNENIISKVKLKEAAVKKTIYINGSNADEIKLTLVAENLGSIPPNTGLLIIQDGTDRYQIRFSADMETNASVIIKKKR